MVAINQTLSNLIYYLPEISKQVIEESSKLPPSEKEEFLNNYDSPLEHEPKWHQWGILSHSIRCLGEYKKVLAKYNHHLDNFRNEKIGNLEKINLLNYLAPLHDLGKLCKGPKDVSGRFDFGNHEVISREIILSNKIYGLLRGYGLSQAQIEYIADFSEKHSLLGELRQKLKKTPEGYTPESINNSNLNEFFNEFVLSEPRFLFEKGLFFISDSLAKTDINFNDYVGNKGSERDLRVIKEIKNRGLNPSLIEAVLQRPVNILLGEKYLEYITNKI